MTIQLRFSEAIRLGAMLRPQCFNAMYKNNGSCALGAAREAVGASNAASFVTCIVWPWTGTLHNCPVGCDANQIYPGANKSCVTTIVVHLNDVHHWTRERIADWVESIEPDAAADVETIDTALALALV